MAATRGQRRDAYVAKASFELASLRERGVETAGNAFSSLLLVKGELSEEEAAGAALLSGPDGRALASAFERLGYAPEDWASLSALGPDGAPLAPGLAREAVCCLDPDTLVALDDVAADLMRQAFAEELVRLPSLGQAMLADGEVAQVLGMRVIALGGFAASLASPREKQLMWARLKQIPPLGEPY
ncbi:MAG: hypothetical protein LKG38_05140 [Atopobiaceae bacterium]|nr:hypothetical protein [Atopobiaceae bacterium]MCH4120196.1 hypothetical protein [Atopobiaceae bacterium]MCI1318710.1 hypothetical protein [Atopobiaceae bacterium]MCI1389769.1 hypothetical protein [Atopobiaceae bacterium]MCI1432473.1 hypothetical protein [Atopobiaceae bacterium]